MLKSYWDTVWILGVNKVSVTFKSGFVIRRQRAGASVTLQAARLEWVLKGTMTVVIHMYLWERHQSLGLESVGSRTYSVTMKLFCSVHKRIN